MKRTFLFLSFALSTLSLFAEGDPLTVTKKNRGLFGYKSVNETFAEGMHTLTCLDPGRTACRTNGLSVVIDETLTLSADELATIDNQVTDFVNINRNESGTFVFASKAVIVYSYDPDKDQLIYTVYSVEQANELNIL
jgi:hypothetical protein